MNPIRGYTVINFLHWLVEKHPEVYTLKDLPESDLLQLVGEFEGGRLDGNDILVKKWLEGFRLLFESQDDWGGYDKARNTLENIELLDLFKRAYVDDEDYQKLEK